MLYKKSNLNSDVDTAITEDELKYQEAYRQGYSEGKTAGEREACKIVMEIVTHRLYDVRKEILNSKRLGKVKLVELLDDAFGLEDGH